MNRSLSLLLAGALSAPALPVGAAALGVALLPTTAEAADFTGTIKRVRLKKRAVGNNQYRAVVRTSTEGAVPAEVLISYEGLDTGAPEGPPVVATEPASATILLAAPIELGVPADEEPTGAITLECIPMSAAGAPIAAPFSVVVPLTDGTADPVEFTWERGDGAATFSVVPGTTDATLSIDLDSNDWGPDDLAYLATSILEEEGALGVAGQAPEVYVASSEARWVADLPIDPSGYRYNVTAQAFDANGELGASAVVMRSSGDADLPGPIQQVKVAEKPNGDYKVVTWAALSGENTGADLSMVVTDSAGDVLRDAPMNVVETTGHFVYEGLTFQDDPNDFAYATVVTFLDATGAPVAAPIDLEVIVGDVGSDVVTWDGEADPSGASPRKYFLAEQTDGTWAFAMSVDGAQVPEIASVVLEFEEPFEGPEPDELSVIAPRTATWVKARKAFSNGGQPLDGPVTVTLSVVGDVPGEGETFDFSATAGVAGFGSGTKKSTNTTKASTPQLQ